MFECRTSKAIFQSKTWKKDFSKTVLKLKFSLMLILMSGFDFSCRSRKGRLVWKRNWYYVKNIHQQVVPSKAFAV